MVIIMDFSILRRKWITAALLSVVLPMSLLATFRLTGVLREPQPPQTITVGTVELKMSRPVDNSGYISIDEKVENSYTNNLASIIFGIHYSSYTDNSPEFGDLLIFAFYANANISKGFICSIFIQFSLMDAYGFLDFHMHPDWIKLQNLEIRTFQQYRTHEPYIDTHIINQPKYASLKMITFWMFVDENDTNHRIIATLEVRYFNGTTYQTITVPIQLLVICDEGDTLQTARLIQIPAYERGLVARNDEVDLYKFQVNGSRKLDITMTPPADRDFDLELLNSTGEIVDWSRKRETGAPERIVYDIGGSPAVSYVYYVKVIWAVFDPPQLDGKYTLEISEYT